MALERKPKKTRYRKPCPDKLKGEMCPLCGCRYICGQFERKKKTTTAA